MAALAALLLIWSTACSKAPPSAPPEQVYTVRGRVVSVPDPGKPQSALRIQHERIPDFVNSKGQRVGMESMAMPFPAGEGLDLAGIAAGDPVEFTWEVRWSNPRFSRVTRVRKLPPDTELNFGGP